MIKKVKTEELKVGMYVMLGESWLRHSFIKPNFMITSEKQIRKIISNGIKETRIDTSKSEVIKEQDRSREVPESRSEDSGQTRTDVTQPGSQIGAKIPPPEPGEFKNNEVISNELKETIENTSIPPPTKAKAVYSHSIRMMANVLKEPSVENILSGKKMVYKIVDHILTDDDIAACMSLITSHDHYTYTHSVNVGMLSVLLAKSVFKDNPDHDMQELGAGFFFHDLGKCDLPPYLNNKPGKLTIEEWNLMQEHPAFGHKILKRTGHLTRECKVIVLQHHERDDGAGYPHALSKYRIHTYARICALADVYDGLTSMRAHKKYLPPFEALKIMKREIIGDLNRDLFEKFVLLF